MAATLRVLLGTNVLLLIFGLVGGTFCLVYALGLIGDYGVADDEEMWHYIMVDLRGATSWLGFLLSGLAFMLSFFSLIGIVGTIKRKKGILLFYIIMMSAMILVNAILACFILCATSIPFCDDAVQTATTELIESVPDYLYWDKEQPKKEYDEEGRNVVEKTFECYGRAECQSKIPDQLSNPYNIMAIVIMGMTIIEVSLVCLSVLTFRRVKRGEKIV